MATYVDSIHPTNVNEVDYIEASEVDGLVGDDLILLTGDWHGLKMKGLQIGNDVVWFTPEEQVALAEFLSGEVK